jgi:hypothetical protein
MTELQLSKFIHSKKLEIDWRGKNLFLWIPFKNIKDLTKIIGYAHLWEGGIDVTLLEECVCVDLVPICEHFGIDPESMRDIKEDLRRKKNESVDNEVCAYQEDY